MEDKTRGRLMYIYMEFAKDVSCYWIMLLLKKQKLSIQGSLAEYIKQKKTLSENEAGGICYQILLAVEYLHSCTVIHMDLKPVNILRDGHNYKIGITQ